MVPLLCSSCHKPESDDIHECDPYSGNFHDFVSSRSTDDRMRALIESFPTLRPCPSEYFDDGFDPVAFGRWGLRGGGGRKDAALFCLSVWNSTTDWDEHVPGLAREGNHGRFELHRAFANWDHEHRAAFMAFCSNPWWP